MNQRGQVLIEHSIDLLVLVLPLTLGILRWGALEYQRTRCAHAAFLEARKKLIQENNPVEVRLACGRDITESIRLTPLREIESPDPLFSLKGLVARASSLWGELSHLSSSSSEQVLD